MLRKILPCFVNFVVLGALCVICCRFYVPRPASCREYTLLTIQSIGLGLSYLPFAKWVVFPTSYLTFCFNRVYFLGYPKK
jgi:hypothetical protein